eukprot:gene15167-21239_t
MRTTVLDLCVARIEATPRGDVFSELWGPGAAGGGPENDRHRRKPPPRAHACWTRRHEGNGDSPMIQYLLRKGSKMIPEFGTKITPLMIAARGGYCEAPVPLLPENSA